jgi:D-beta-D-heptose 7-phosphate kinase/D-beta-D-heptose 1-phosphate adenosyltransferase
MNRRAVQDVLARLPGLRVAVVGDLMLDRYITGHATRISPEAPVPIVRVQRRKTTLGGAANVLLNCATLGLQTAAFGLVGDDEDGRLLLDLCRTKGIATDGVVCDPTRPTTVKTRVIADRQQVVRIDDEVDEPIAEQQRAELARRLFSALDGGHLDAVIIEDYNKGVINAAFAGELQRRAAARRLFTALDPHPGNPLNVPGLSLMTPNRMEAFALAGAYLKRTILPITDDAPLLSVGHTLMSTWRPDMLLVTLGAEGMALFHGDAPVHHVPTVAREVFDVSGAGDTVIAAFTAAHLAGLPAHEAMVFANHAAGVVVGKVGTVPIEPADLLATFPE